MATDKAMTLLHISITILFVHIAIEAVTYYGKWLIILVCNTYQNKQPLSIKAVRAIAFGV